MNRWIVAGVIVLVAFGVGVVFFRPTPGDEVASYGVAKEEALRAFALSPDGSLFAVGRANGTVELRDVATGSLKSSVALSQNAIRAVCFGADNLLAVSGDDKVIHLVDSSTGSEVGSCSGHTEAVTGLSFTPDGKFLASSSRDKTVRIWNVNKREEKRKFKDHKAKVATVAWSPSGKRLASGDEDGSVHVYDLESGHLGTWKNHTSRVLAVAFDPTANKLYSAGRDGHVMMTDFLVRNSKATELPGGSGRVEGFAFPGPTLLAAAGEESVRIWNLAELNASPRHLQGHEGAATAIQAIPGHLLTVGEDGTVKKWAVPDSK